MSAIGPRQSAAIARIEFQLADGTTGQGTGFAVARDRLLTAWHVMSRGEGHRAFFGGKAPEIVLGRCLCPPPSRADRDDWVLVECVVPESIEPLELAPLEVKQGAWRSRGFPIGTVKPINPSGKIATWGDGLFELSLDAGTAGADPAGASGSPVFVEERVVGILIESRGNAGGLLAIDAASILKSWPVGESRPSPVPYKVPFERWVAGALKDWIADQNDRRRDAANELGEDLDPNDLTPARLARVLLTSSSKVAVTFVEHLVTGKDRESLIDVCCSLWVHQAAANALSEVAFTRKELAVMRFAGENPVLDHLCCAEGYEKDNVLPLARSNTLPVKFVASVEPGKDALWLAIRKAIVDLDPEADESPDAVIIAAVNSNYVAIAVKNEPTKAAVDEVRKRGLTIPVVTFSKTADSTSANKAGGVLIEPFADPILEAEARIRWGKRLAGGKK